MQEKIRDIIPDVIKWWLIIAFAALAVYVIMPWVPWWQATDPWAVP